MHPVCPEPTNHRLLALSAEVGIALSRHDQLNDMLEGCALALAGNLDADLARIWVLDSETQVLELQASAGLYTHLNGAHSRIKVGELTVGKIAQEKRPHLTNDVITDERISDRQWAASEGIVAFAGHPLCVQNKLVGVMAIFSRNRLGEDTLMALNAVATHIAIGIKHHHVENQLRERDRIFAKFSESVRDVFWISTPKFDKHIYVSPSYEAVFGRPVEELYANPDSFMGPVLLEDREALTSAMELMASTLGSTDVEFRIVRPDGNIRWLWVRSFPVVDAQGNIVQICGVTHDNTERKEAQKRVSEFYSVVSHELRTPLTSIRAALGLIEGGLTGGASDETLDLVKIARSESDRLIRLINDILDIRKMEAGKLEIRNAALSPVELVGSVLAAMRGFAQENQIHLTSLITDDREFLGDRDRVLQVLTNLISNAIKFSPAGSEVSVRVLPGSTQGMVRFCVIDRGSGIPENKLDKLFGLFQQLDSSDTRALGGTGLGLAICKAVVERLGGCIGLDSKLRVGSTFWFELPSLTSSSAIQPGVRAEDLPNQTILDFLVEYRRSLPGWLEELKGWLQEARQHHERKLLHNCLLRVRKIRGSAEPCGFPLIAESMRSIEFALCDIIENPSTNRDSDWTAIELALATTSDQAAIGCNTD